MIMILLKIYEDNSKTEDLEKKLSLHNFLKQKFTQLKLYFKLTSYLKLMGQILIENNFNIEIISIQ